jgi:ribosomal protein S18 acetylase RimI-like enzyme
MKIQKLNINTHNTKKVSELIYETDKDLFLAVLSKDSKKAVEKLQSIVETGKNPYGYENIQVASNGNQEVLGILTAFKGEDVKRNEEVRSYFQAVDFNDFLKLILVKPVIDRMVAFADIQDEDYYIGNIAVDEDLRGDGIGSELLQKAKEDARKRGCDRILLDVLFSNKRVIPWYERYGFRICGKKSAKKFGIDEGTFGMEYVV